MNDVTSTQSSAHNSHVTGHCSPYFSQRELGLSSTQAQSFSLPLLSMNDVTSTQSSAVGSSAGNLHVTGHCSPYFSQRELGLSSTQAQFFSLSGSPIFGNDTSSQHSPHVTG